MPTQHRIDILLTGAEARAVAWHINNELDTTDESLDVTVRIYSDGNAELSIDGEAVNDMAERLFIEIQD